ncbi:hypothetical protein Droror1_Dr00010367 [Drosera rotundifolia]
MLHRLRVLPCCHRCSLTMFPAFCDEKLFIETGLRHGRSRQGQITGRGVCQGSSRAFVRHGPSGVPAGPKQLLDDRGVCQGSSSAFVRHGPSGVPAGPKQLLDDR